MLGMTSANFKGSSLVSDRFGRESLWVLAPAVVVPKRRIFVDPTLDGGRGCGAPRSRTAFEQAPQPEYAVGALRIPRGVGYTGGSRRGGPIMRLRRRGLGGSFTGGSSVAVVGRASVSPKRSSKRRLGSPDCIIGSVSGYFGGCGHRGRGLFSSTAGGTGGTGAIDVMTLSVDIFLTSTS